MAAESQEVIYRHRLPVRVMHWINVICLFVLLGSGLQIFNAHPSLYWGADSREGTRVLQITQKQVDGEWQGVTRIGGHEFDTHGVLGTSRNDEGKVTARAFPSWATIPGPQWLALGRVWHFFFAWLFVANGACYLLWTLFSGHLRHDLVPTKAEWRGIEAGQCRLLHLHHAPIRALSVAGQMSHLQHGIGAGAEERGSNERNERHGNKRKHRIRAPH